MLLSPDEAEVHRGYMRPLRGRPFISIAIPTSITSDAKTLREQTIKIGYIGRAAAIFRVEEIMVYSDGSGDPELIRDVLSYIETPPYLKRVLIPLTPKLRFAGVIPPLKAPHHVPPDVFGTMYREGVVLDRYEDRCLIDIGLDRKGLAYGRCPGRGSRVTVQIVRSTSSYYLVDIVDRSKPDVYWGYSVYMFSSLKELLTDLRARGYLVIVASKKGTAIDMLENSLANSLRGKERLAILFGGPYLDVDEIAYRESIDLKSSADYVVNFIPRQGVVNIRTEEAVIAALSITNYLKEKYCAPNL